MSEAPILAMMAQLCLNHRQRNGNVKPRELRLLPKPYRLWREASPGTTDFFGVPVRCVEVLPNGWHLSAEG
jgi:hypothetical protein